MAMFPSGTFEPQPPSSMQLERKDLMSLMAEFDRMMMLWRTEATSLFLSEMTDLLTCLSRKATRFWSSSFTAFWSAKAFSKMSSREAKFSIREVSSGRICSTTASLTPFPSRTSPMEVTRAWILTVGAMVGCGRSVRYGRRQSYCMSSGAVCGVKDWRRLCPPFVSSAGSFFLLWLSQLLLRDKEGARNSCTVGLSPVYLGEYIIG